MAGRRPIPTEIKILRGNPGKRRLNHREPKPAAGLPPCPRHLKGIAAEAWRSIGAQLVALHTVTLADLHALELLVSAYAEYRRAQAIVERRGATYATRTERGMIVRRRPEVAIAGDAWRRVKGMLVEFGLTPAARSRVSTTSEPLAGETSGGNALERFLERRQTS
jgi:P27 family predicted phage terminase small subunit